MRVPNRFSGMRDLAYFSVIFGIWVKNRGGNYNYERERDFVFLWDVGLVRGTDTGYGISMVWR